MHLVLDVWREAGSSAPLSDVIARVATRLAEEMRVEALLIRRLEAERQRLDTMAHAAPGDRAPRSPARTQLSAAQLEALVAWGRGGDPALETESEVRAALVPKDWSGDTLLAPLVNGEEVMGYAIALGRRGAFGKPERGLWEQLREPLSAALRIELQHHEITRFREAMQADRQALLSRLGRQEIADAIVGVEGGLRGVVDRASQVAQTDVPVLLLGETGTGKEVIAREIHRLSSRSRGPVVRVNCGAIPPGLIDSELFGHERGSFTGAVSNREGWFERADGGTLFLDEIGELPPEAQVRLLRVLQDGTFERVGGRRTHSVEVRIVAATHRDLHSMVQEGRFREDLWYRISVFPISIPPLRARPGDIPPLAEHFAWRAGKRLGGFPLTPTPSDLELLIAYPWPGNVRELAAVIERAVILGGGRRMEVATALGVGSSPVRPPSVAAPLAPPSFQTLEQATRRHIEAALSRTGGQIEGAEGAAALLNINPHTLRARMRKLGLDWTRFRDGGRQDRRATSARP